MPITVPRRWGRWFRLPALALIAALTATSAAIAAGAPKEQIDYLCDSLKESDAPAALSVFDPHMKDFAAVRRDIEYLATLSGTNCEVKVNGAGPQFETEWKLELNPRQNGPLLIRTEKASVAMQQIGGEWKITGFAPLRLLAKPDPAIFDRVASFAGDLSAGDSADALAVFSSGMKDYGEISADIDALVNQTQVLCAIDIIDDNETADIHELDTDWYLQLQSAADAGPTERRRQRVRIQMELIKGKWRVTALSPLEILAPIKVN